MDYSSINMLQFDFKRSVKISLIEQWTIIRFIWIENIVKIEYILRKFTRYLVHFFYSMSYSERLGMLRAESLELRRLKSDLTLIYRTVHGISALDFSVFLQYVTPLLVGIRGN